MHIMTASGWRELPTFNYSGNTVWPMEPAGKPELSGDEKAMQRKAIDAKAWWRKEMNGWRKAITEAKSPTMRKRAKALVERIDAIR